MTRAAVVALVLAVAALGCRRAPAAAASDAGNASVVVKDDTQGMLFTWIDDKGDFHVVDKPADVPMVGRDAVRVSDPSREEGVEVVSVADLRVAGPEGAYPVHTMSRDDFDGLALSRRMKGDKPTLAGVADAGVAPSAPEVPGGGGPAAVAGRPTVIVYGASWCSACHQAMAYFKKKGITFIEKDIEQDPQAASEMQGKLRRAGLRAGGIPVLDVRGRILVGFEPHQVDEALGSPI